MCFEQAQVGASTKQSKAENPVGMEQNREIHTGSNKEAYLYGIAKPSASYAVSCDATNLLLSLYPESVHVHGGNSPSLGHVLPATSVARSFDLSYVWDRAVRIQRYTQITVCTSGGTTLPRRSSSY